MLRVAVKVSTSLKIATGEARRLKLMQNLSGESYIVGFNRAGVEDNVLHVMSLELADRSLHDMLRQSFKNGVNLASCRFIAAQLFKAVSLLHANQMIHGDLKPDNVLLLNSASSCDLVVADLGSALDPRKLYEPYLQSRFYRSPEVILNISQGYSIDVWSLGVILVEIYVGATPFRGRNGHDMIAKMAEVIGMPSDALLKQSPKWNSFFYHDGAGYRLWKPHHAMPLGQVEYAAIECETGDEWKMTASRTAPGRWYYTNAATGTKQWERPLKRPLEWLLNVDQDGLSADATSTDSFEESADKRDYLDLVNRCLTWDPERRITAAEALGHPFFSSHVDELAFILAPPSRAVTSEPPASASAVAAD